MKGKLKCGWAVRNLTYSPEDDTWRGHYRHGRGTAYYCGVWCEDGTACHYKWPYGSPEAAGNNAMDLVGDF